VSSTGLTTMSMYSELLAMSLSADDAAVVAAPGEKQLLEELREHRHRLQGPGTGDGRSHRADASSHIATELGYDRALIKLCRLHAIPCDPARFTRPSQERRRLEEALEAAGVEVNGTRQRGALGPAHAQAQEPPDGS
jgi:hypothetical protein